MSWIQRREGDNLAEKVLHLQFVTRNEAKVPIHL